MKRVKISKEKNELKQGHHLKNDPESLYNKLLSRNETENINIDTPFHPRMKDHTALLEQARTGEKVERLLLHLQRSYGNAYVQRLVRNSNIQTELTDKTSGDKQESEADKVDEKVVRTTSSQVQRQEEEELEYPGPRSKYEREDVLDYPGSRTAPLRENMAQERRGSGLSLSTAQRAAPHSSATGGIGDAVNLDGEAMYGWDRTITASDVETVVNGVVPTVSSDEEMPRIVIYSGTHGNEAGHLVNDATSRGFVAEDQATASAASSADPQVQAEVIDVVTGYPAKSDLTANYGRTNYIRILAWCFSKRSYDLSNGIKSNWWQAPDNL